jgi:hypothetical protein
MTKLLTKPGNVLTVVTAILALGGLYAVGMTALNATWPTFMAMAPLTNQELDVTLRRVGLTAEDCCAAGLTSQQTTSLVGNARSHLDVNIELLRTADEQRMNAKAEYTSLKRLVQSGQATQQDLAAFQAAGTALDNAEAAVATALSNAYDAALGGLAQGLTGDLGTLKGNTEQRIDTQYRIVDRTEADWVSLRRAIAAIRIAQKLGEDPPPESLQIVNEADADPDVSAAKTKIDLNLDQIQTAWNQAVYGQG